MGVNIYMHLGEFLGHWTILGELFWVRLLVL